MKSDYKIGFIGTGLMGSRIIRRLAQRGFHLAIQNRTRAKAEALAGPQIEVLDTVAEVAQKANVIVSSLTNDQALRSIYLGPDGVLAHASKGSIVIEMSTVDPDTSRWISIAGCHQGVQVLDVAVSGSTVPAERGELTLFVGGNEQTLQNVAPLFEAIAKQWFYMGPSGSGTAAKLVVNSLLGVGMQAIAEAVVLGQRMGLPRAHLLEVLSHTAVIAPAFVNKLSRIEQNEFSPQFSLGMMNKDFGLILEKASSIGARMPATTSAYQINQEELRSGREEDFSAVIRLMEELSMV